MSSEFGKAFAEARSAGKDTFEFKGNSFTTERADDAPTINNNTSNATSLSSPISNTNPTPSYEGTFNEAFAAARDDLGAGKEFTYKDKTFTTDRADDVSKDAASDNVNVNDTITTATQELAKPEPTKPADPEPTKPADPEPTKPADPEPTKPVDPEPTKPADPVEQEPIKPADPEPTKSAEPTKQTEPTKPAENVSNTTNIDNSGASLTTAKQDGLKISGKEASNQLVDRDMKEIKKYKEVFKQASKNSNIEPEIIASIASRESRAGKTLDKDSKGDHGKAYGMMQIDESKNPNLKIDKSSIQAHVNQAVGLFKNMKEQVKQKHPDWNDEQVNKGAAVAYNSGIRNVKTIENIDKGTTGNDYGSDVIARANRIKQQKIFDE